MTREQFDQLVRQVEQGIGRHPAALQRRVARLALLGFAGLLAWVILFFLLALVFLVASLWLDLEGRIVCWAAAVVVLFVGGGFALKALLVKLPKPEGFRVTAAQAPGLFVLLTELQRQLRTVPFHEVLITPVCNAGVAQRPRLGPLGWSRNYLLLGLPLLDGLSRAEVRAVLAHEFGHLSRAHGRFSHWLYRLRRSWQEVFNQLQQLHRNRGPNTQSLLTKFLDWFWPRFNAHAFVLSRANEYDADAQAAQLAGREALAASLIRLDLVSLHLEELIWTDIWQLANDHSQPPADVFLRLRDCLRAGPPEPERSRWLQQIFQTRTTNADTHPCLSERLVALNPPPFGDTIANLVRAAVPSAAEELLGDQLDVIRAGVQQVWARKVAKDWQQRHARAASLSHRLASLHQAVPEPAADVDSLWDQARVLLDLQGDRQLEPLLRRILALRADHVPANFQLGRLLLEAGNAEGEIYLERVMAQDEDGLPHACAILHEHHRRTGRLDKLREVELRLDRYEKAVTASNRERAEFTKADTLIPHGLSPTELQSLHSTLAAEPQLARAELAQKQLQFFPRQKFFILCVHRTPAWHRLPSADLDRALVNRIARVVQLPGRLLVIPSGGSYRTLARKFRRLPDCEVYRLNLG